MFNVVLTKVDDKQSENVTLSLVSMILPVREGRGTGYFPPSLTPHP